MPEKDTVEEFDDKRADTLPAPQDAEVPRAAEDVLPEDTDKSESALPFSEDEPCKEIADEAANDGCEELAEEVCKAEPPKTGDYDPEKPRKIDNVFDFVELLILTLAAVFILTSFVFRHSIVDGDSMMNTLQDHDVLIISDLFYTPEQYDIVVIEDHTTGYDHPLVKRVIAVGGDEVRVTADKIYVNGEPVRDDFVYTGDYVGEYHYTHANFTVPEGEIYVLGDHRNNSSDSRKFGSVSTDAVLGKVLFRIYPFSEFGNVYTEEK